MPAGWIPNPDIPSCLWQGLVFDGAFAGLHPGTLRYVDGSGRGNDGTLAGYTAAFDGWAYIDEIQSWGNVFNGSTNEINIPSMLLYANAWSLSFWLKCVCPTSQSGVLNWIADQQLQESVHTDDLWSKQERGAVVGSRPALATPPPEAPPPDPPPLIADTRLRPADSTDT
jgi:hypothetical protein